MTDTAQLLHRGIKIPECAFHCLPERKEMRYAEVVKARFLSRPNRFIAQVELNKEDGSLFSEPLTVHVKNTGRCRELLVPGVTVYLEKAKNQKRKTQYDLIAVEKGEMLVNIDSQAPNGAVREWLSAGSYFENITLIKPEVKYGNSRFDFYIEAGDRKIFLEVKGVTLENGGVASFPDAPTLRGVKHIEELIGAAEKGYEAYLLFVIQMKGISYMHPNDITHPEFGQALRKAGECGVHIIGYDCVVKPGSMEVDLPVEVRF